jgi:hypothetical protein
VRSRRPLLRVSALRAMMRDEAGGTPGRSRSRLRSLPPGDASEAWPPAHDSRGGMATPQQRVGTSPWGAPSPGGYEEWGPQRPPPHSGGHSGGVRRAASMAMRPRETWSGSSGAAAAQLSPPLHAHSQRWGDRDGYDAHAAARDAAAHARAWGGGDERHAWAAGQNVDSREHAFAPPPPLPPHAGASRAHANPLWEGAPAPRRRVSYDGERQPYDEAYEQRWEQQTAPPSAHASSLSHFGAYADAATPPPPQMRYEQPHGLGFQAPQPGSGARGGYGGGGGATRGYALSEEFGGRVGWHAPAGEWGADAPPPPHGRAPRHSSEGWGAAGSAEQWRGVQASLRAASAATAAAAALAAAPPPPESALSAALIPLGYALRRLWYTIDSRLGSLPTQVALLMAFAVFCCVAFGAALQAMRTWAAAQGRIEEDTNFAQGVWLAWSLLIDPGMGVWPDSPSGLVERMSVSVISIIGILYLSLIVGLVVGAVQAKMEALKQGLATVVEQEHTVILGWAEQSLTIIRELAFANASEGGGVIVVLASAGKQAMEAELASFMSDEELMGTKVVFRTGSRLRISDLRFVAADAARAVIIISNMHLDPDTADAEVLQVVLNLTTVDLQPRCAVVAEIRDIDNEPLVAMIGVDLVHTVTSHDIIGRLMLLFLRAPGLARVYGTLLGFEGSELYVARWDALTGVRWGDVALRFPHAVPIGLRAASGAVLLNPPASTAIRGDDELIVLAEDNDSYACEQPFELGPRRAFRGAPPEAPARERVLFAGWRRDVAHMIALLDRFVLPGSELHILCPLAVAEREKQFAANGMLPGALAHLRLIHHIGNCASQRGLELVPLASITSIVVLSEHSADADVVYSDSHVLASLFLIRGLQAGGLNTHVDARGGGVASAPSPGGGGGASRPGAAPSRMGTWDGPASSAGVDLGAAVPMVVEILDPRTQRTVNESYKVWSVSEFIQSSELISKMLAMIAEEPAVKVIIDALLGGAAAGTLLALVPAGQLVGADQVASFWEVSRECTAALGATLCGWLEAPPPTVAGQRAAPVVVINPPDKALRRSWYSNQLVMVRTDARLKGASAVAAPSLGFG